MTESRKCLEREMWYGKNYSFINHKGCEAFPCHESIGENEFNCLFCYCPLYFLDESCGGAFTYTSKGIKDCSACTIPHEKENYSRIIVRLTDAIEGRR